MRVRSGRTGMFNQMSLVVPPLRSEDPREDPR